ncbi:MAG: M13 family metallopeptidase, partial [Acidobacteriota bacterium]|nr:M13 family metallopeptidase [Acidobacteriota bacterium]
MRFVNFRVAGAALTACLLALAALAQNGGHGFDTSRMDTSASACTDFYQFANGNWMKTTQIPAAFPSWGSFNILAENNRNTLRAILDEAAKNTSAKSGSIEQKIGDFYATCTDEQKREAEGAKPLAPYLARIDKVNDLKGVEAEIAYFHREGIPVLFGFGSEPDFKNSSMNIGTAGQGGLSLPNKDYYTKTDEKSKQLREAFVRHVSAMFQLLGDAPAQADKEAQTVLAIETRLAENSRSPVELRDV